MAIPASSVNLDSTPTNLITTPLMKNRGRTGSVIRPIFFQNAGIKIGAGIADIGWSVRFFAQPWKILRTIAGWVNPVTELACIFATLISANMAFFADFAVLAGIAPEKAAV